MEIFLSQVLPEAPRAAVIWLLLLAVVIAAAAAIGTDRGRSWFDGDGRIRRAALPDAPPAAATERQELTRYADEVTVAADRAGTAARRWRDQWSTAAEEAATAWVAYEMAEAQLWRLDATTALPAPRTPRTPAEYAERERHLHRSALAAYWRGDLTVAELSDVFAHRAGWDPRLHPVHQEVYLARRVRDSRAARHRAAVDREQAAWQEAEAAAVAARSLRQEAMEALARLTAAGGRAPEESAELLPWSTEPVGQPATRFV